MAEENRPAIITPGFRALIEAVRMYLDTDNCVCEEEGECPPDCEQCMYCIGWKAMWLVGEYTMPKFSPPAENFPSGVVPDLKAEMLDAVESAEEWLTEFRFDESDEGAMELIAQLRDVMKKAGSKVYEHPEP